MAKYEVQSFQSSQKSMEGTRPARAEERVRCTKEAFKDAAIHPESILRRSWNGLLLGFLVWNTIVIPVRAVFPVESNNSNAYILYFIDYFGDLMYMIELYWSTYVGYSDLGVLITERKRVRRHYLCSKIFVLDFLTIIPLDLMFFADARLHAVLRLNRFFRLYKLPKFFASWERVTTRPNFFRLVKLMIVLIVFSHWSACAFYWVVRNSSLNRTTYSNYPDWRDVSNDILEARWSMGLEAYVELPFRYVYPRALYWAITVLMGMGPAMGAPYTDLEAGFFVIVVVVGVLVVAAVVSNVSGMVTRENAASGMFRDKKEAVSTWMRVKEITPKTTTRIMSYYNYLWARQKGLQDEVILNYLPPHLRASVAADLNNDMLKLVPFFQDVVDEGFLLAVVQHLRLEVYTPGEYICHEGEMGSAMYFVTRGEISLIENGVETRKLKEGAFFEEDALLVRTKRTLTAKAEKFVDVLVLEKEHVDQALLDFPEVADAISMAAAKSPRVAASPRSHVGSTHAHSQLFRTYTSALIKQKSVVPDRAMLRKGFSTLGAPSAGLSPNVAMQNALDSERSSIESNRPRFSISNEAVLEWVSIADVMSGSTVLDDMNKSEVDRAMKAVRSLLAAVADAGRPEVADLPARALQPSRTPVRDRPVERPIERNTPTRLQENRDKPIDRPPPRTQATPPPARSQTATPTRSAAGLREDARFDEPAGRRNDSPPLRAQQSLDFSNPSRARANSGGRSGDVVDRPAEEGRSPSVNTHDVPSESPPVDRPGRTTPPAGRSTPPNGRGPTPPEKSIDNPLPAVSVAPSAGRSGTPPPRSVPQSPPSTTMDTPQGSPSVEGRLMGSGGSVGSGQRRVSINSSSSGSIARMPQARSNTISKQPSRVNESAATDDAPHD